MGFYVKHPKKKSSRAFEDGEGTVGASAVERDHRPKRTDRFLGLSRVSGKVRKNFPERAFGRPVLFGRVSRSCGNVSWRKIRSRDSQGESRGRTVLLTQLTNSWSENSAAIPNRFSRAVSRNPPFGKPFRSRKTFRTTPGRRVGLES